MKVYDCFTFFDELDLLEIRLRTLDEAVDHFVIVEATRTFSNRPKPLYFAENRERFDAFSSKIVHVVVDDYPEFETAWTYENHQRNCIERGLRDCRDDDVILISDLDEIPRPDMIRRYGSEPGIHGFEQSNYRYYLNYFSVRDPVQRGTKMLSYRDFRHALDDVRNYGSCNIEKLNRGTTANKIRTYMKVTWIPDGGWHFSYLGGIEAIRTKIRAYSHQENNYEEYTNLKSIQERIERAFRTHRLIGVEPDDGFPAPIREDRQRYSHLIGPLTPENEAARVLRLAPGLILLDRVARFSTRVVTALIPIKPWRKRVRHLLESRWFGQGW